MKVRQANIDDVPLIFSFISKKSKFDREIGAFSGKIKVSETKIRNTIFRTTPFAYVLFACVLNQEIGFALYGFRYSSFAGQPSIWLDDLYIDENMRNKGAGKALMNHLMEIAQENNCTHIAWTADKRNIHGLSFYERLGAKIIKKENNRYFFEWIIEENNL